MGSAPALRRSNLSGLRILELYSKDTIMNVCWL